jgi:putative copper resistance protein D
LSKGNSLLFITPTVFAILALFICIGTLACNLFVLPPTGGVFNSSEVLRLRLWHLLAAGVAALTISSITGLFMHAMETSDSPISEVFSVLPIIILRSRYGHLWVARPVALAALWIGWWVGRRHLDSGAISVFMLGAGAVIAMTRSASGHAADWGDLTLPELMDWLHLLSGSIWGGTLMALSIVVLPKMIELSEHRRALIAYIARRFSRLAGITLGAIIVTATYNAWTQVGSYRALWETSYGQIVIAKILLLLMLMTLGASNRYISLPLLHNPVLQKPDRYQYIHRFMYKIWAEAVLIIFVVICTAFLLHWVPARHSSHIGHGHSLEKSKMGEFGILNRVFRQTISTS